MWLVSDFGFAQRWMNLSLIVASGRVMHSMRGGGDAQELHFFCLLPLKNSSCTHCVVILYKDRFTAASQMLAGHAGGSMTLSVHSQS